MSKLLSPHDNLARTCTHVFSAWSFMFKSVFLHCAYARDHSVNLSLQDSDCNTPVENWIGLIRNLGVIRRGQALILLNCQFNFPPLPLCQFCHWSMQHAQPSHSHFPAPHPIVFNHISSSRFPIPPPQPPCTFHATSFKAWIHDKWGRICQTAINWKCMYSYRFAHGLTAT